MRSSPSGPLEKSIGPERNKVFQLLLPLFFFRSRLNKATSTSKGAQHHVKQISASVYTWLKGFCCCRWIKIPHTPLRFTDVNGKLSHADPYQESAATVIGKELIQKGY